jgi:hypothetical protein
MQTQNNNTEKRKKYLAKYTGDTPPQAECWCSGSLLQCGRLVVKIFTYLLALFDSSNPVELK